MKRPKRIRALGQAQEAARAGAQAIDLQIYRQRGELVLNPEGAVASARTYLTAAGPNGVIAIEGQRVVVTVHRSQSTRLLRAIGIGSVSIHATGSARPVRGVITVIP